MTRLVISGGQCGADLGGISGAAEAGIKHRIRTFEGFTPIGRTALPAGVPVELLDIHPDLTYGQKLAIRTVRNVAFADGTVVFVHRPLATSRGTLLTINECVRERRPLLVINLVSGSWLLNLTLLRAFMQGVDTLNVAGQRSASEALVARYIAEAFGFA